MEQRRGLGLEEPQLGIRIGTILRGRTAEGC
jgi:hypothetical protein